MHYISINLTIYVVVLWFAWGEC